MSAGIELFDAMLRGGASLSLILIAALILNGKAALSRKIAVAALAFGLIDYVIVSSGQITLPAVFSYPAAFNPIIIWWLGLALFRDDFRPRAYQLALALVMIIHVVMPAFTPLRAIVSVTLYAHLLYIAIATRKDDLIETRLRFRSWFLGLTATTGAIIGIVEIRFQDTPPEFLLPIQAAILCLLCTGFLVWLTQGGAALLIPAPVTEPREKPSSEWKDSDALSLIQTAMNEGTWRQEGLTIIQLASELSLPERRLRQAINLGLGHRNFSAYINSHRIAHARAAFADPKRAGETILAIAYDSGFASLGPFNRTFRAETGQNPTEYRRKILTNSG
jgi:AraC-like DNA-binding protein